MFAFQLEGGWPFDPLACFVWFPPFIIDWVSPIIFVFGISPLYNWDLDVREAPFKGPILTLLVEDLGWGKGRGGLILARMVWGTYLEKNCPGLNGHLLVLGLPFF